MGDKRLFIIRPYALYGSISDANHAMFKINAMTNNINVVVRNNVLPLLYVKRFFFLCLANHEIKSCIIPSGHITEQYILPKIIVINKSVMTVITLSASIAGINWIFAIQPKYAGNRPEKSRKRSVIPTKNNIANVILILRNIIMKFIRLTVMLDLCCK